MKYLKHKKYNTRKKKIKTFMKNFLKKNFIYNKLKY